MVGDCLDLKERNMQSHGTFVAIIDFRPRQWSIVLIHEIMLDLALTVSISNRTQ